MEYQRSLCVQGPRNVREALKMLPRPGQPYQPAGHRIVRIDAKAKPWGFFDWLLRRPRFWSITVTMESDPPEPPEQEKSLVIHENP